MKKILLVLITAAAVVSCKSAEFDAKRDINVISREDGSGTRSAFIELFGIEERGADGARRDKTTIEAVIAKQTDIMLSNIAQNNYTIGYVSVASLNETVKSLSVDGAEPTVANIKSGAYSASRPFFIAHKNTENAAAKDFIAFIISSNGENIISKNNYISVNSETAQYVQSGAAGKIVVAGSSSVTPLMEKLKEAYIALNPAVKIEVQMSDSSAGISAVTSGIVDIAMSSRDLKETELAQLLPVKIAIDGIAVCVNKNNPLNDISKDDVKNIFTGSITKWNGIIK